MNRMLRVLACGLAAALLSVRCQGASFNGVTYVDSGEVALGQWNGQFVKAKAYAEQHRLPIVVVWVNPGCGYCENFERNVMSAASVKSWMQARRYVFAFAINGVTSDADSAFAFIGGVGGFPFVRAAIPGGSASATFTARMTASAFMEKVDGALGGADSGSGSGSGSSGANKTYALKLTASPSAGGSLSGAGSYAAGKKVTVRASPAAGYVFSGWYSGSTLKSQATSYALTTGSSASTLTGKFVLKTADKITKLTCPLKSSYVKGEQIAAVAVAVAATSLPTVKVSGLPPGLSYSASTGKIAGKPTKSGLFTAVVAAKSAGGALRAVTNEVVVRASGEYVLRIVGDAAAGKTAGAGVYASGRRLSLRATPARGRVFLGWYDGSRRLSESRSFAYVQPAADTTLTAKFATAAEDAAAVTARIDGLAFGNGIQERATNVVCGVAVSWPVSAAGLTATAVSVSGLPSGLSYSAKTGLIAGVPSAAQTKTATIVARTYGGTKVTYRLKVAVQALPVYAIGTFNGGGEDGGLLTLTVGSSGRMSGKYLVGGTNWTLSARSYSAYDVRHDALTANLLATCGKTVLTNRVTVAGDAESLLGQLSCARFTGWWNGWKTADCREVAKAIDRAADLSYAVESPVPGTVSLAFGSSGAVLAKGTFVVGENPRTGRAIAYSASCSTVLCRQDDSNVLTVFIYFPPKKNVFAGYSACIELAFDGVNLVF